MSDSGKVVWIINQFAGTPESGWGERHYYLGKYWQQKGYEVKIISGSFNHMFNKLPNTDGIYTIEEKDGLTFCWVKSPFYQSTSIMRFWSMLVFAFRIYKLPIQALKKPDIILVSSMPIFPILPAHSLKKKYNARKLIVEIRDLWPLTPKYLGGYWPLNPMILVLGWFEKFAYKKSDAIVTVMHTPKHYINAISGNPKKLFNIQNGVNQEVLTTNLADTTVGNAIPKDKFIVGYAGTLGLANAMEYFIDAAKLLVDNKDICFVIIGDGYLKEDLVKQAKGLDNVIFLDKVLRNQLQTVIKRFDICFISGRNLSLYCYGVSANKFFDYMLAAKPILAAYVANNDPIKMCGCGLRVFPEDPNAIKDGILRLYHTPKAELEIMGAKGKEYLLKKHDIKILADQFIEVFEKEID
jgi:glycosyltransferase involved in cell wall biosynthesis